MSKEVKKKTGSKLSLRKVGGGNSENTKKVLIHDLDLNETCEFKQAKHPKAISVFPCPSVGQTKRSQDTKNRGGRKKQQKTDKELSNSEDKVPPEEQIKVKEEKEECTKSLVHENIVPASERKKVETEEEGEKEGKGRCLACGEYFPRLDLNVHVTKCLQSKFNRTNKSTCTTENQEKKTDEVKEETEESYFCLFCKKDLSRLNSKLKTQHLNRCMDKDEKRKNEEEMEKLNLERASKAVLSCPMCGKPFRTENARKVHLKKCALSNGITTDQILKLVKDQEEEHKLKLAAGIIPPEILKVKSASGSGTANVKDRKVKEPKSQFDEDTQLAMAISSSLNDDEKEKEAELIGQTLGSERAAAMNMQLNNGNRKRKQNKKGGQDSIPLLLALSEEEKTRRRELKVSSIVLPQDEEEEVECTPTFKNSELGIQQEVPHLWRRSSLDKETSGEDFYVSSLMPPIEVSKAAMGTKIRRMSEIPGRRRSLSTSHQEVFLDSRNDSYATVQKDNYLIASTQTAVVLAELAASAEEEGEEEELDTSVHCSGFCPERTIKIKGTVQSEVSRGLQTDMLGLVNNKSRSDVTITVENNLEIYAHSLILHCRCPALLQMIKDSRRELLEVSSDVMLVVLRYLYAGHISLCRSNVNKTMSLSKRLKLDDLTKICEDVLSHDSNETDDTSAGHRDIDLETITNRESDLDRILTNVWGDSSSEEEEDQDPETCHESSKEVSPMKTGSCNTTDEEKESTVKKRSVDSDHCEKSTFVLNDLVKRQSNSPPCPVECKNENREGNSDRNQEDLQQEINNFFQDDSFDMTCDVEKDGTDQRKNQPSTSKRKNNRDIIFEDNEVVLFDASGSSSSSDSVCPTESCKNSQTCTFDQVNTRDKGMKQSSCNQQNEQKRKEKDEEADIIISSDESDNEISGDQSRRDDFEEKNKTRQLSPQEQQRKSKLLQYSKLGNKSRMSDGEINVSTNDQAGMGSSQMLFQREEENSPIQLSPDLIEDDIAEDDVSEDKFHFLSLSSRKRKRSVKKKSSPLKSPVVVVKSPEKTESFHCDTPVSNAETSGLDLFGSPSPCSKRRKTDSPGSLQQDVHYIDDKTVFSKYSNSPCLSLKSPSPRKSTSEDKVNNNSPVFSHSQKHGIKKLLISGQHFDSIEHKQSIEPCKSNLDQSKEYNVGKNMLDLAKGTTSSGQIVKHVVGDVDYLDNDQKTSQGSPIFHTKVKKKWKFTKTNNLNSQIQTSPNKVKGLSPNTDLVGLTPKNPANQAVWLESSPTKLSQDNNPTAVDEDDLNIDQEGVLNMSIPGGVWDDFDDSGAGFVGPGIITSATPKGRLSFSNEDECEVKIDSNIRQSPAVHSPNLSRRLRKSPEYLRVMDQAGEFDDSFVWGGDTTPGVPQSAERKPHGEAKVSFKTPTVNNKQRAETTKPWVPPSPFTPMPSYDSMNTPQLKREVGKIGVRPVGKKRMIALLKDVYDKTHQYETDSNCEDDDDDEEEDEEKEKDTEADELNTSQESTQSDMVEESFMQGSVDDLMSSQLSQKDDTNLSEKLEQFFMSRTDIYSKTLMYEPLEVDWLKKEITEAGIKCSMQKLLDFLDEMCITFTMKKMRQERNARRGKGRGKSSKKGTEGSPSKKGSPKKKRTSPSKKGSPTKKKTSKPAKGSPQKRGSKNSSVKTLS